MSFLSMYFVMIETEILKIINLQIQNQQATQRQRTRRLRADLCAGKSNQELDFVTIICLQRTNETVAKSTPT